MEKMTAKKTGERVRSGMLAGLFGIVTNVLLAVAKIITGTLTKSVSVTADAVNNFSDAGASVLTMLGFKLSAKPADREHPFGHARYEYITGLVISFIVLLLGGSFFKESILKIINRSESVEGNFVLFAVLSVSILVKVIQGIIYRSVGKKIKSESLFASSADSFNDSIITTVVLIGSIVRKVAGVEIDGYIGAAVAAVIIIAGIKLVIGSTAVLIGKSPDEEFVKTITEKVLSYDKILGVHDLIVHSYGVSHVFASLHAEVNADDNVLDIHDEIDNIERDIYEEFNVNLVIHMDPVVVGDAMTDEAAEVLRKILSGFSDRISFHDFRLVKGPTHINMLFDVLVPPDFGKSDEEIRACVEKEMREKYPTAIIKMTVDKDFSGFLKAKK